MSSRFRDIDIILASCNRDEESSWSVMKKMSLSMIAMNHLGFFLWSWKNLPHTCLFRERTTLLFPGPQVWFRLYKLVRRHSLWVVSWTCPSTWLVMMDDNAPTHKRRNSLKPKKMCFLKYRLWFFMHEGNLSKKKLYKKEGIKKKDHRHIKKIP